VLVVRAFQSVSLQGLSSRKKKKECYTTLYIEERKKKKKRKKDTLYRGSNMSLPQWRVSLARPASFVVGISAKTTCCSTPVWKNTNWNIIESSVLKYIYWKIK